MGLEDKTKHCFHCKEDFEGDEGVIQTCCPTCKRAGHGQDKETLRCEACRAVVERPLGVVYVGPNITIRRKSDPPKGAA
jgi:hypothetical protein